MNNMIVGSYFPSIRFLVLGVLLLDLIVMLGWISFYRISSENITEVIEKDEVLTYKFLRIDKKSNFMSRGIVSMPKSLVGEFKFSQNENEVSLISNFGSTEYKCYGSCYCEKESNRRVLGLSNPLQKGLVFLTGAITLPLAYHHAKKHYDETCVHLLSNTCSKTSITSSVNECEKIELDSNNNNFEKIEERLRYHCRGACVPNIYENTYRHLQEVFPEGNIHKQESTGNWDQLELESHKKIAKSFKCEDKLGLEKSLDVYFPYNKEYELDFENLAYKENKEELDYKLLAKQIFVERYLSPYCLKNSIRSDLLDWEGYECDDDSCMFHPDLKASQYFGHFKTTRLQKYMKKGEKLESEPLPGDCSKCERKVFQKQFSSHPLCMGHDQNGENPNIFCVKMYD